jgi:hypothetical protein
MNKKNSRTINRNQDTEYTIFRKYNGELLDKKPIKNNLDKNKVNESKLKGGSMEKLPYRSEKNTPFLSNDQRNTFKKRSTENPPPREPPIILEQKVYDTSQRPPVKPQFPPTFIPLYDPESQMMNHIMPYSNRVLNQPPVQKVYNVSLSNPLQGFTSINRIYEDMLPGGDLVTYSALTIYQRRYLIDFMRNSILENCDGEEMSAVGSNKSLLEYIKIMEINPYSIKRNPYLDLPKNFLIYRAGYPIRYDTKTKVIELGKQAMGLNIRMYMMSLGDLRCKTINNLINADNFDLWREIKYYDWVKNNIIKNKVSPNFISPILYKIDSQSKIDWTQLDLLKNNESTNELIENQRQINKKHQLDKQLGLFQSLLPLQFRKHNSLINNSSKDTQLKPENKEDLTINSGKVLVLITEAPTTTIVQWSSSIYETFGSVKKMISTGFHTPDVWKSILFQLVYACSILQSKQIFMEKFSLENNIYIKDIFSDTNVIGSWIYKVDSIEYYIPNYGYILMVDSKYADIELNSSLLKINKPNNIIKYKLYSKTLFNENSIYNNIDLSNHILIQFKQMIDPDNFNQNFKAKGGSIPDSSILDLLKKMHDDTLVTNIKDFIPKYFGNFVHNRVGTLLTNTEKENINLMSRPNFIKGNLMIWQKRYQEYEWVIYLADSSLGENMKKILIKDASNNYIEEEVFIATLFSYPSNEKIYPESSKNMRYDESHIYETYNLDNLVN